MSFKNNYFNGSAFWKTFGHFLIKLSMPSIIWLQNSTPEYLPKVKTWFHTKTGVQMITVAFLTSPKLEASQVSFIWGMYKAVMHLYHGIHLHHGILLSTKGRDCGYTQEHEWISNALCYVKKKIQMLKGCHLLYHSIYVTFSLTKLQKTDEWLPGAGVEGTWGENLGWWKCSVLWVKLLKVYLQQIVYT